MKCAAASVGLFLTFILYNTPNPWDLDTHHNKQVLHAPPNVSLSDHIVRLAQTEPECVDLLHTGTHRLAFFLTQDNALNCFPERYWNGCGISTCSAVCACLWRAAS